uniref:HTH CENPB-type domain-containing protein n=1 Tax=Amphimedon queenslandica TaxID=400682 RepID=A0A1X7UXN4_AMPQE
MGMSRKTKTMKLSDDVLLDQCVYLWFKQKRMKGEPVSGPLLCEKAVDLSKRIHNESTSFK